MRNQWVGRRAGLVLAITLAAGLHLPGCGEHVASTGAGSQQEASLPSAPEASVVRYHAAFEGKERQAVQGGYRIENHDGDLRLTLDDAFTSDDGPDLHVVLSPVSAGEASGSTAMAGGEAFVVGKLTSFTGPQAYDLPDDLDFSTYKSVLIQCVKYSHLFGAAELE